MIQHIIFVCLMSLNQVTWDNGQNIEVGGRRSDPNTGFQLEGLVADVEVFGRLLEEEEAEAYTSCASGLRGDLASWSGDSWEVVGNLTPVLLE